MIEKLKKAASTTEPAIFAMDYGRVFTREDFAHLAHIVEHAKEVVSVWEREGDMRYVLRFLRAALREAGEHD